MITRINPPHPQSGPVAFLVVCLYGVGVAVSGLLALPVGTEQWWVGVMLLVSALAAGTFIDGGWLWIQREVGFADDRLIVRRWTDISLGRPGRTFPLDGGTRSAITLENVRSLRLERDGVPGVRLTLGYWEPKRVRQLIDALRAAHVPLDGYWVGEYPPWSG